MVGVYSDLQGSAQALTSGPDAERLSVRAALDSRFTSTPTLVKFVAMLVCILATLLSLVALHRLDGVDNRRARRILPAHWWRFTAVDAVVVGTLLLWHVIGANTSDDGYILTMARASDEAGYMANYYRWFGVPEAPFGWYYDVLVLLAKVSTASVWMRLPALLAAIACWMVISREVIPRLGVAVRRNRIALWTAGLVFLAFWLPYDNGLRPEPVIALGALLTWCSIERAVATGRMLPAAIAVLLAAFSLAAGPTGLIAVAALVAGARPVVVRLVGRRRLVGVIPPIAAILAAGTVVLVVVFADQTLASVLEATRVRSAVGPNVPWFDERLRWDALLTVSPDGSLSRRFGVFVMLLCLIVCVMLILRKGRIPGTALGPSRRILGIVFASLLLMMLTPTKWTHHFGVYAGLAGSVAALAAVGVGAVGIRSARNRALFTAGVLFVLALAFTGSNGWWYVSSYGIPWWDKPPSISGRAFSTGLLALALVALGVAAWFHLREPFATPKPDRNGRVKAIASAPLTVVAAGVVLFEVLSLVKGAVAQYPAYSIARSNTAALTGGSCGLADDVLVETDPNATALAPVDGDVAGALGAGTADGFTPNGVALDLTADEEISTTGGANTVDTEEGGTTTSTGAGTGGGRGAAGINDSTVALPFGLDPARTPVLGSYRAGAQQEAVLESGWYALPDRTDATPLLVVTVAGRVHYVDPDGVLTPRCGRAARVRPDRRRFERRAAGPRRAHRHRTVSVVAQPAGAGRPDPRRRRHRPPGGDRRQPGPRPVGGGHAAADAAPRDPEHRRRLHGTGPARLVGGVGVPLPASVRPSLRCRRGPRVPDPARPGRGRLHQRLAGRHRGRPARLDTAAAHRRDRSHLSEPRLGPRLGLAGAILTHRSEREDCRDHHRGRRPLGLVDTRPDPRRCARNA